MFSIARKAASRLRFANLFNRAIGLTTNATVESNNATAAAADHHHHHHHILSSESTRHYARGARSRRRRVPPALHDATTAGDSEPVPTSRLLANLRDRYRGATAVRTRVRRHNELRKERSLQRILRTENAAAAAAASASAASAASASNTSSFGSRSTTATAQKRDFRVLARNVHHAMVTSEVPKTEEDAIFERGLAELVVDFVEKKKVVDKDVARDLRATWGQIDKVDFMAELNKERARVELAMAAKEAEEEARKEKKERERKEKAMEEERQRQKALEEIRLVHQGQIREAEERRAEARRKADEDKAAILAAEAYHKRAEDRLRQLQAEHEIRLQEERRLREQERQARVEAERIARLERERISRLEEEARLAREREAQRFRDEEQARMWMDAEAARIEKEVEEEKTRHEEQARARRQTQWEADEQLRRQLDEFVQSNLNPQTREEANQRFKAQADRLRADLEELAKAQAHQQWFQSWHPQEPAQECWSDFMQDTPMRDPSEVDISMASIPPLPQEHQFVLPRSDSEWYNLYETRWQELRGPGTSELAFPSFPWPVFRFIHSLDELTDDDIKCFFSSKYPGKLDKNWKVELTRWHPDKVERLRSRIRPDCVEFVRMGFLKCTMVMNAFQEEKDAGRT